MQCVYLNSESFSIRTIYTVRAELVEASYSHAFHIRDEVVSQPLQRCLNALLAAHSQRPQHGSPDQHGLGAQAKGLDDVSCMPTMFSSV